MKNISIEQKMQQAEEAADFFFPGEKWLQTEEWGERIFVSSRRKIGAKSNFKDELRDAQILRDLGSTVYLLPEDKRIPGKKYDAIVDGLQMEFKNMRGIGEETLLDHFYESRQKAPNVFINLEQSLLTEGQIMRYLYGARNSPRYDKKNIFPEGGMIILKIRKKEELVYINIDDLKK